MAEALQKVEHIDITDDTGFLANAPRQSRSVVGQLRLGGHDSAHRIDQVHATTSHIWRATRARARGNWRGSPLVSTVRVRPRIVGNSAMGSA